MRGTCISLFIPHNHQLLKDSWDLNLGLISSEAETLHIIYFHFLLLRRPPQWESGLCANLKMLWT